MVWELALRDAPRPALPQPPSHVFSLPIELLLQLLEHLRSILSARYSRPAAPRAGWPGTVPAPAAPRSATCCAPRASDTDSKARGAGSGPGEAAPVAAGGHITGLPSVTQGSQGPLKFVEVLMTLSFADIWTGNSSGPLGFNLQGGKTLLTDTPSI